MNSTSSSIRPLLEIDQLTITYTSDGVKNTVLNGLSLQLAAGKFTAVVGPSGCGKSTLLNATAGYLKPDSGTVKLNNQLIEAPSLLAGFVSQNYSLFEWLTVEQNIAFGLKYKQLSGNEIRNTVDRLLEVTGLKDSRNSYPAQLSGGMQQRVALARSIAPEPAVLLLDEPFSALDTDTRIKMRALLLRLWNEHRTTILFVTHDIEEAVLLADSILLLQKDMGAPHIVDVPFPRPRQLALRHSADFRKFVEAILAHYSQPLNSTTNL